MNTSLIEPTHTSALDDCITPLPEVTDAAEYGEKAFRLAEMHRLGHPVPNGIVVRGSFFAETFSQPDIGNFIDTRVRGLSLKNLTEIADAAGDIEDRILKISLPDAFVAQLENTATPFLSQGPVAVRSSACGEDSTDAAFAGQLDSFLGITSQKDLQTAILRCWASYWSHRSLAYQLARNVQLQTMGVIIQQQVDAKHSGVLFTRNIQNPSLDQLIIEYCEGLGEKLVSGQINPVNLIIDASGNQNPTTDGNNKFSQEQRATDELDDRAIRQLASTGRQLEQQFDHPQDIEWSVDQQNQVCILQSRPITTLAKPQASVVWSNANVNENFPDPICPLLYSVASRGYYHYFRNLALAFGISQKRIGVMEHPLRNIIGTQAGRMYYNLSHIHAVLRAAPFGEFLAESFNQFVGSESTVKIRETPSWKSLSRGRMAEWRELLLIARHASKRFKKMERGVSVFESTVDRFSEDSNPLNLPDLETGELLSLWRRFMAIRSNWTDAAMADAASMIYYQLTRKFLASEFTSEEDRAMVNRLLTGLCDIVSGLPTEHLWELSRAIRKHDALVTALANESPEQVWQRIQTDDSLRSIHLKFGQFLDDWGFRCSGELMLTKACYQENPASLLPVLATYVRRDGPSPREHLKQQQELRQRTTRRVLDELRSRRAFRFLPFPRKHRIAKWLLKSTQQSVACRERARLKQALLYSRLRRIALTLGSRLVEKQQLEQQDDIFFLTFQEIEDLLCGACMLPATTGKLAELRRTELARLGQLNPPDRIELPAGDYWQPSAKDDSNQASEGEWNEGIGVSGGSIVGRAVVLTDPNQFAEVVEGDILVTRQTDPGWGPILFLVRGLVMERGGMLSHGAILAREFGIPTAVAIQDATQRIATGDTIKVDGDRGRVEILS